MDRISAALLQDWAWLPYGYLFLVAGAAAWIDQRTGLIPNRLTLPSYLVLPGLIAVVAVLSGDWQPLWQALVGGLSLALAYLALAAIAPGQMGMGDVKLAGLLGMGLAHSGWPALAIGAMAGPLFGALQGLLLTSKGQGAGRTFPFAPAMCLGALVGLLAGPLLM
ncbi:MAG: A24 family peptidase [Micrococcales bacterium]|nr:A24 family peptidase [Micrococcales bacterium]